MADDLKKFHLDDTEYETRLSRMFERRKHWIAPDPRIMAALIPGVVTTLSVHPGQKVRRGDPILILEAMKMKNPVVALRAGTIHSVRVSPGQMVTKGEPMVEFE
jgi:biotin carboxyl carrier protein